jgi:cysteine desulfurase/selenocysteine lyase
VTQLHTGTTPLDVDAVKRDFPILSRQVHDTRLVYLDSAATSQKPASVIASMQHFYETTNANIHRGTYELAEEATRLYEQARHRLARFIGAPSSGGVVFTKNVTEAINLVAYAWGRANLHAGDVVVLSELEHHANLVPWLMLKEERGIELRFIPLAEDFTLDLSELDVLVRGAKLVGVSAMSNVLGTITPVQRIGEAAHRAGALFLVDGAQLVPHVATDVSEIGCDFFGLTGHKMLGPTGIGALWAREELLEEMPAFMGGGEMIRDVRLDGWLPNDVPWKFEAGTMPIAEAVGLTAAIDYLEDLSMTAVRDHEVALTGYALAQLRDRYGDGIAIYGPDDLDIRGGVISFSYKGIHPHDLSQVLDQHGVCIRAGHHCAKPLMRKLGINATARASLYVYNDEADVDALVDSLSSADELFL